MKPAEEDALVEKCHADWKASDGQLSFPQVLRLAIRAAVAAERELQAMHDDKQYLLGMRAAAKYVIGDCEILTPPCRTIVEFDYSGLMKAIDSRQAQIDAGESMRRANKIEDGLQRNLNHDEYSTRIEAREA